MMLWWQDSKKPTGVADVELQGSKASPLVACENIPSLLVITQHAYYIDTCLSLHSLFL